MPYHILQPAGYDANPGKQPSFWGSLGVDHVSVSSEHVVPGHQGAGWIGIDNGLRQCVSDYSLILL